MGQSAARRRREETGTFVYRSFAGFGRFLKAPLHGTRGACRERPKRGQSGHQEDRRLQYKWSRPTHGTRTKPCDAPSAEPAPKSLQIGISTSFRHIFASPRPGIPIFPGNFCLYMCLIDPAKDCPRTAQARDISSKGHRGLALEADLGLASPPMPRTAALRPWGVYSPAALINDHVAPCAIHKVVPAAEEEVQVLQEYGALAVV